MSTSQLGDGNGIGGDGSSLVTAAAIARLTNGELTGNPDCVVTGVAALDRAQSHHISILSHARYVSWFRESQAGVVIMGREFSHVDGLPETRVIVEKPMEAMLAILPLFHRKPLASSGIHPTAIIAEDVTVGENVTIDAFVVIGRGAVLGDRTWIASHVSIGEESVIGTDCMIHANASVYPGAEIGNRVVLHSGSRVGREGFGWVPGKGGVTRIPHVGRCILGDDVEIGANSCVDRGSIDDTVIGAGTKVDSLVQIAHNVRIGRCCMIASQVGIAGSTRVEDGVQLGGQVGLAGHLVIGAGSTLAAQAGVVGNVPAGEVWSGYPARPHREQLRASAAIHRLAGLVRPLERLVENTVEEDGSTNAG